MKRLAHLDANVKWSGRNSRPALSLRDDLGKAIEIRWLWRRGRAVEEIDAIQAARALAALVAALQRVAPAGAPPGRGIPLAERAEG